MARPRLKLTIAYDGAPFAGWQSQAHGKTVQDHLEKAFRGLTGRAVRVHGAGRTDTGVHALAQCAHVDIESDRFTAERWVKALNALLPPTIRVLRCRGVPADFHARFSATGKTYRYRIWTGAVLPPLEYGRVWQITRPIDLAQVKVAAQKFVGRHDFAGFAANRARAELDTVRTIRAAKVRKTGPLLTIEFEGDGFLYKMVRMMVGALAECGQGKISPGEIGQRLANGRRGVSPLVAPAAGLYLVRVRY